MKRLLALLAVLLLSGITHAQTVIFEPNDATDVTLYFTNYDKTSGDPNTSPVLTDYKVYYTTYRAAMTAGTALTALATAATAHTDNYGYHTGLGEIRVDIPDAAFAGSPGDQITIRLVDGTGEDRFYPPFYVVQLNPPVDVATWKGVAAYDLLDTTGVSAILDAQGLTTTRAGYLDNIDNADLATTVAQTGDAYVPALAAKTAAEKIDTSTELRTLLTGENTPVAKESTLSDGDYDLSSITDLLNQILDRTKSLWRVGK